MNNVIYEYYWRGQKTGWKYKLEIFLPDESVLDNPERIVLPPGSVSVKNCNAGHEKRRTGCATPAQLSVDFDLDILDLANHEALIDALFNPVKVFNFYFLDIAEYQDEVIEIGPVFTLYYDYNIPGGDDYNIVYFRGCYRSDSDMSFDNNDNVINVKAEHITKCVLDQVRFIWLEQWSLLETQSNYYNTHRVYEVIFTYGGNLHYVLHESGWHHIPPGLPGISFRMMPFNILRIYIEAIGVFAMKKILRISITDDNTFRVTLMHPMLYQQTFDSSGLRGPSIDSIGLYFISHAFLSSYPTFSEISSQNMGTGAYSNKSSDSLQEKYSCIWDFLNEYSESCLCRLSVNGAGSRVSMVPVFEYNDEINVDKSSVNSIKIIPNANNLKTVVASCYEKVSDDDFSDSEKFEARKNGTRNQGEYTVPVVFNNYPSPIQYRRRKQILFEALTPHLFNFYYPILIDDVWHTMRVHEYAEWKYDNDSYTGNLPNCEFVPYDYNTIFSELGLDSNFPAYLFLDMQKVSCIPKWIANAYLALFGNPGQYEAEIYADFDSVNPDNFIFNRMDMMFTINMEEFNSYLNSNYTDWYMLSYDHDFVTESAKVKLARRVV